AREEQRRHVEFALVEQGENLLRHLVRIGEAQLLDLAESDIVDDIVRERTAQDIIALASDGQDFHRLALGEELQRVLAGKPDDRRVEAAGETTLTGRDDQQMNLIATR